MDTNSFIAPVIRL